LLVTAPWSVWEEFGKDAECFEAFSMW